MAFFYLKGAGAGARGWVRWWGFSLPSEYILLLPTAKSEAEKRDRKRYKRARSPSSAAATLPSLISLMVSVDVKHHVYLTVLIRQSPGEIKRREVELGSRSRMECLAAQLFLSSCFSDTGFVTLFRTDAETVISAEYKSCLALFISTRPPTIPRP